MPESKTKVTAEPEAKVATREEWAGEQPPSLEPDRSAPAMVGDVLVSGRVVGLLQRLGLFRPMPIETAEWLRSVSEHEALGTLAAQIGERRSME